jgi:hypothetical protein
MCGLVPHTMTQYPSMILPKMTQKNKKEKINYRRIMLTSEKSATGENFTKTL